MRELKRWAALNKHGDILTVGFTHGNFERICLRFSALGFMSWVKHSKRYCQLYVDNFNDIKWHENHREMTNISMIPHGRIRKLKGKYYR